MSIKQIDDLNNGIQQPFATTEQIDPRMFDESLRACDEYIASYGSKVGFTEVYRQAIGRYDDMARNILIAHDQNKTSFDASSLKLAYRAASQINKIHTVFNREWLFWDDLELQVDALTALERTDEAELFLKEVISHSKNNKIVNHAKSKLKSIERSVNKP